ncbi:beta-ketoacyl synthase N-terminal-like domain-containing protein [Niabella insulamsoli]|uniref:beta-ketoacyl synthase N-terminal-like domain-containing protein n=1 Tax=Niabella insulamsoli TaxID=3144874 RepID=UPI0031FCC46A
MRPVYVVADHIISPLGADATENFDHIKSGKSSVQQHAAGARSDKAFYASLFPESFWSDRPKGGLTNFEWLLTRSITEAMSEAGIPKPDTKTGLILSSTKGNIGLLEQHEISKELKDNISLTSSAEKIRAQLGFFSPPVIISHACISGLVALITAKRMIEAGLLDTIVVAGADLITRFILSGFQSFQAVSDERCRPFDAARKGINLGEAAATIILSCHKPTGEISVRLAGGAVSNDANHISGPSRTGKELYGAIKNAMKEAGISAADIDFASLHGTATVYNDDMESKAIHLAGLQSVPVNSLKAYFGHTLGAAGLIESILSIHSLKEDIILPTMGFQTPGTAENITVCSTLQRSPLQVCLKTASGFGGCNAAVLFRKEKPD